MASMASTTSQNTSARGGYAVGQRTRDDIIHAACDIIAEQGYDALTAAALATRAGISKGGLYHHFERMGDIVIAAYEETAKDLLGGLRQGSPKNFDEYLDQVESVVFERLLKDKKSLRIISELYPRLMFDPSFRETRKASFSNMVQTMSEVFATSFRSEVDRDELGMAINTVGVFLIGLAVQHGAIYDPDQSRALWRWFRGMLNDKVGTQTTKAVAADSKESSA